MISHSILELDGNGVLRDVEMSDRGLWEGVAEVDPTRGRHRVVLSDIDTPDLLLFEQCDEVKQLWVVDSRGDILDIHCLAHRVLVKGVNHRIKDRSIDVSVEMSFDLEDNRVWVVAMAREG